MPKNNRSGAHRVARRAEGRRHFTALSAVIASMLTFAVFGVGSIPRAAAAGSPLSCSLTTIYNLDTSSNLFSLNTATGVNTLITPVVAGGDARGANALAVADGGSAVYFADRSADVSVTFANGFETTLYKYDPVTGTTTTTRVPVDGNFASGKLDGPEQIYGGALNPVNGVYYYIGGALTREKTTQPIPGSYLTLYGYDPATGTPLGSLGVIHYTDPLLINGDIAFDGQGTLYVLEGDIDGTRDSRILRVSGAIPSTPSTAELPVVQLTTTPPSGMTYNGIAFDASGTLFAQAGALGGGSLQPIDPNNGALGTLVTQSGADPTHSPSDLGTCTYPGTLTLHKNIVGRANSGDQFNLSITGNGIADGNTGATSGATTGLQTDPSEVAGSVIGMSNETYTFAETASGGADLADYVSTYECTDAAKGNEVIASGTGTSFDLTVANPDPGVDTGPEVNCVFTNTPNAPAITVLKTASPSSVGKVGDTITYSFRVTNSGNVPLTSVSVTDTQTAPAGPLATGPSCPVTNLAPGASTTCTGTYTVQQADIDHGKVEDVAIAHGTPPTPPTGVDGQPPTPPTPIDSPPSPLTVPDDQHPALKLVKSVKETLLVAKQTLHYTFVVTNVGNVTITNVTIAETAFSGTGLLSPITCPAGAASMAPGASIKCSATYVVTAADAASDQVTNTAVAEGKDPHGKPVTSPPSKARVPGLGLIGVADTGVSNLGIQVLVGAGLVLGGGFLMLGGSRRRRRGAQRG